MLMGIHLSSWKRGSEGAEGSVSKIDVLESIQEVTKDGRKSTKYVHSQILKANTYENDFLFFANYMYKYSVSVFKAQRKTWKMSCVIGGDEICAADLHLASINFTHNGKFRVL